jgi:glucose 1-dehydrogenase
MEVKDKVALITGSAKRVGKALALALAERGCHIYIHYGRSAAEAVATVAEVEALGVDVWSIAADLNDEAAVQRIIPTILETAGRLDILINSASIFPEEDFMSAASDTWDRNMMINLKAPFLLSQAFAKQLDPERPGKIINLLDTVARRPKNHHFSYTISKFGLEGLTKATAYALAERNIQVNGLALGTILPGDDDSPDLFNRFVKRIPARRLGSVEDVVKAMLYLIEEADYITGDIIHIDGGWHLV